MRHFISRAVEWIYWIATGAAATLGVIAKTDRRILTGHLDPVVPLFDWLKDKSWLLVIATVTAATFALVRKRIEAPWVRKAVKHILDEMRSHAFNDTHVGPNHHYRVTLFRRTKGVCWRALLSGRNPFGGWLVPFARSGYMTQKISVVFAAPDDADLAEGIAGQAFAQDLTLVVEHLPEVSEGQASPDELEDYANRTFVNVDWLKKEKSTARALMGMPVKVKGEPWGAIVVDSRGANIPNRDSVKRSYELIAKVLGEILDRSES